MRDSSWWAFFDLVARIGHIHGFFELKAAQLALITSQNCARSVIVNFIVEVVRGLGAAIINRARNLLSQLQLLSPAGFFLSLQDPSSLFLVQFVATVRIAEALRDGLVLYAALGMAHVGGAKLASSGRRVQCLELLFVLAVQGIVGAVFLVEYTTWAVKHP